MIVEELNNVLKKYHCKNCGSGISLEFNIDDTYNRFEIRFGCDNERCRFYNDLMTFDNIIENK